MLKAVCNAVTVEQVPFSEILTYPDEEPSSAVDDDQEVSPEVLQGTALTTQDWHKARSSDDSMRIIIESLI